MDISDKALNTLTILRNATWLDGDSDIIKACRELVEYFEERCNHENFEDNLTGSRCIDCGLAVEEENTCWNCNEPCSLYSEYQDDARTFCSLDCLNEATAESSNE